MFAYIARTTGETRQQQPQQMKEIKHSDIKEITKFYSIVRPFQTCVKKKKMKRKLSEKMLKVTTT